MAHAKKVIRSDALPLAIEPYGFPVLPLRGPGVWEAAFPSLSPENEAFANVKYCLYKSYSRGREIRIALMPGLGVIGLFNFQDVRFNQAVGAVPGAEPSPGLHWVLCLPGGHGIWI